MSGSIVVLGAAVGLVAVAGTAITALGALTVRQSVAGAADAAALAAADVAIGLAPGLPCEVGATVARANGAGLSACEPDGLVVTVTVTRWVLGIPVSVSATAGPAP